MQLENLLAKTKRVTKNAIVVAALSAMSFTYLTCSKKPMDSPKSQEEKSYVLEEKVIELSTDSENKIKNYNPISGQIIFEKLNSEISSLKKGDIIIAGISEKIPYGFLRKIDTINSDTLKTSKATFNDAIKECKIHSEFFITPQDLKFASKISLDRQNPGFSIPINSVLYDEDLNLSTTNDQIILKGNLSFQTKINSFDFDADGFGLNEFILSTTTTQNLNLNLNSKVNLSLLNEKIKFHPDIFGVPVQVGPIVIVPKITFYSTLDGKISISEIQVSQEAKFDAGISYDGNWNQNSELVNKFNFEIPNFSTNAQLKVSAGPQVEFLAYDVAGAYLGANGFIKANISINSNPWWTISGGLETIMGAKIQVFGWDITDYSKVVLDKSKILAQANPTSPISASLILTPNFGTAPLEVLLDASASNPNIKEYHFIFGDSTSDYFETLQNFPDGNFDGKTRHSYLSPGNFSPKINITDEFGRQLNISGEIKIEEIIENDSILIDERDGQIYKIVKIGNQTWMAQNLNYFTKNSIDYLDGTPKDKYGRFYNFSDACSSCPSKWHLPSLEEFKTLVNFLGGNEIAGGKLKEKGWTNWKYPNTGATNESGFTAIPGGFAYIHISSFSYDQQGRAAHFYSSDGIDLKVFHDNTWAYTFFQFDPPKFLSVRCIKDK